MITAIESKNDECGAKAKMGASFDDTWRPDTFTRWNEPTKNIPRIAHDANTWTNLFTFINYIKSEVLI